MKGTVHVDGNTNKRLACLLDKKTRLFFYSLIKHLCQKSIVFLRIGVDPMQYAPNKSTCTKQVNMHQTSQYASNKSICIKQVNMHQTIQYAPNKLICTKQDNMHKTSQYAPNKSICTKLFNMHQTSQYSPK